MNFESAMNAAARGKLVRRGSWPINVVVGASLSVAVSITPTGEVQTAHPTVIYYGRSDVEGAEQNLYYASMEDRGAEDWDSIPYALPKGATPEPAGDDGTHAPANEVSIPEGVDANGSPTNESTPAPESNAQPEDTGNAPADADTAQSEEQQPVSVDTPATAPAEEVAAPVEEVMQDSGATAPTDGA